MAQGVAVALAQSEGLGKELGQAHGSFAKKAADQGFVAHHELGNGQFKGKGFGGGGFAVAGGAHQKNPVAWFEVMGAACNTDAGRRGSRQPALRPQPQERARGPVEADRGDWGRGFAVSVELEMGG